MKWDIHAVAANCVVPASVDDDMEALLQRLQRICTASDKARHIVIMSNGSFQQIYQRLPEQLTTGS